MESHVFTHDGHEYTVLRTDADLGAICSPGPDTYSHVGALNAEILRLAEENERLKKLLGRAHEEMAAVLGCGDEGAELLEEIRVELEVPRG